MTSISPSLKNPLYYFREEILDQLKKEHPEWTQKDIMVEVAKRWRKLPVDEQDKFKKKVEEVTGSSVPKAPPVKTDTSESTSKSSFMGSKAGTGLLGKPFLLKGSDAPSGTGKRHFGFGPSGLGSSLNKTEGSKLGDHGIGKWGAGTTIGPVKKLNLSDKLNAASEIKKKENLEKIEKEDQKKHKVSEKSSSSSDSSASDSSASLSLSSSSDSEDMPVAKMPGSSAFQSFRSSPVPVPFNGAMQQPFYPFLGPGMENMMMPPLPMYPQMMGGMPMMPETMMMMQNMMMPPMLMQQNMMQPNMMMPNQMNPRLIQQTPFLMVPLSYYTKQQKKLKKKQEKLLKKQLKNLKPKKSSHHHHHHH